MIAAQSSAAAICLIRQ